MSNLEEIELAIETIKSVNKKINIALITKALYFTLSCSFYIL